MIYIPGGTIIFGLRPQMEMESRKYIERRFWSFHGICWQQEKYISTPAISLKLLGRRAGFYQFVGEAMYEHNWDHLSIQVPKHWVVDTKAEASRLRKRLFRFRKAAVFCQEDSQYQASDVFREQCSFKFALKREMQSRWICWLHLYLVIKGQSVCTELFSKAVTNALFHYQLICPLFCWFIIL